MTAAAQTITAENASSLAGLPYSWEVESAPAASPAIGPAWLGAYQGIDPRVPPCQYLLARSGDGRLAALPMHVADAPTTPDADPRSYFGAAALSPADRVCCGSLQDSAATQVLANLDIADVFPALILGSLPGYRTEIMHSYWTPGLAAGLIDAAVGYARAHGIATIIAPWVADLGSAAALARELERRQAVASFWAVEHYLPLRHESLEAQIAAARSRDRYRYNFDMATVRKLGIDVRTLSAAELGASLPRIGALAAATRRRHGQDIPDTEVATVLARLLDRSVPLLAVGGFQHGTLVACCVSVEKAGRIYAKHAGFDYDILGTRSGAHFAVVMYGTLAAAYDRKASLIEYGVGAHQAKAFRGCQSRDVTSYLLTDRPHVRDIFRAAAALNSPQRRAEHARL